MTRVERSKAAAAAAAVANAVAAPAAAWENTGGIKGRPRQITPEPPQVLASSLFFAVLGYGGLLLGGA